MTYEQNVARFLLREDATRHPADRHPFGETGHEPQLDYVGGVQVDFDPGSPRYGTFTPGEPPSGDIAMFISCGCGRDIKLVFTVDPYGEKDFGYLLRGICEQ